MHRIVHFVSFLALTACGPSDIDLPDLGITVTAPSGWSVEMSRESSISAGSAELKKGKKTFGFIDKGANVPLGSNDDAWPDKGEHTLDQLKAALAPFSPTDPETFATGFGVQYTDDGKPHFLYVTRKGDTEYSCSANDWIAKEDVPAAISICKSIR
jgi:hypothetical protein